MSCCSLAQHVTTWRCRLIWVTTAWGPNVEAVLSSPTMGPCEGIRNTGLRFVFVWRLCSCPGREEEERSYSNGVHHFKMEGRHFFMWCFMWCLFKAYNRCPGGSKMFRVLKQSQRNWSRTTLTGGFLRQYQAETRTKNPGLRKKKRQRNKICAWKKHECVSVLKLEYS